MERSASGPKGSRRLGPRAGHDRRTLRAVEVASPWFQVRSVTDRLTRIDEPHADELVQANVWHLRGSERDLVVDTGLGVASLRQHLPALFAREPVVVLSHAHFDHSGGAHEFDDVWAHRLEPLDPPIPGSLDGPRALRELGLVPDELGFEVADCLIEALPEPGYQPASYAVRPVRLSQRLDDGDVVDLGDRQLSVLHLPGHTPGSIGLYDESDGTLFSGDVLYDGELIDTCTGADVDAYVASLLRLRELPVSVVHAGHADSIDPVRMRQLIDQYVEARRTSE
jgi:glyoxylase-like metal-dependent hydrolase (beta-lactamase superfamily II)